MTPRRVADDPSPAEPFSEHWYNGDDQTPVGRIALRRYVQEAGERRTKNFGSWYSTTEDLYVAIGLEALVELRDQVEHEIDGWILYGLDHGVSLRQMAEMLGLTRQGLSKRLATRRPEGYDDVR